ncbi:7TM GPCR protein [Aphelenchoides avenae]|nr:7TM GPCR protein [Aphelenchus avenae]
MLYIDELYHFIDSPVHFVAIALNLVLLYLNVKCSTSRVKTYQGPLLMSCLGDLLLAIVVSVSEVAFLYEDGYFILVANGFVSKRNELFDIICASLYCGMIHAHAVMVVVQFIWRYQIICRADSEKPPFVKSWWVLVPIAWCVLQASNTFYLFSSNQPGVVEVTGRQLLERVGWQPGTQAFPGMGHRSNIHTALHHCFYMVTLCGGYGIVIWCQFQIIKFLHRNGKAFHENTRRTHAEVNRAMVTMAITPLLTSMGPTLILVICMIIDYSPGAITVYFSVGMSMITIVNPITTIYFVRAYRHEICEMLKCPLKRRPTSQTLPAQTFAAPPSTMELATVLPRAQKEEFLC